MSTGLKKWDVVLLAYPFTDLTATKVRPAVVISPDSENAKFDDAVFLLITSNTTRLAPFDLVIAENHPEFSGTGLLKSSAIRINKIITLRHTLTNRTLGRLGPRLRKDLAKLLAEYFEI